MNIRRLALVALFAALGSACSAIGGTREVRIERPRLIAASGNSQEVVVSIRVDDLAAIAREELYASILVFDCRNEDAGYPAISQLGNIPLDEFYDVRRALEHRPADSTVEIHGPVLISAIRRMSHLCVRLTGGGYLGRVLRSNVARLEMGPIKVK